MNCQRNKDVLALRTGLMIPGAQPMSYDTTPRVEYTLYYYCVGFAFCVNKWKIVQISLKALAALPQPAAAPRSRSPLRSLSVWIPLLTQLHKWSNGNIAYAYRPYNRTSTPPVDKESSPAAANALLRRRVRRRGDGTSTHPSSLVHRRLDWEA